jgi:hypothetical protein
MLIAIPASAGLVPVGRQVSGHPQCGDLRERNMTAAGPGLVEGKQLGDNTGYASHKVHPEPRSRHVFRSIRFYQPSPS